MYKNKDRLAIFSQYLQPRGNKKSKILKNSDLNVMIY